nr:ionotropic glutamate receptor-11 [Pleurobrachia bachei]
MILVLLLLASASTTTKIGFLSVDDPTQNDIMDNIISVANITADIVWMTYDDELRNMSNTACSMLESGVAVVLQRGPSDDAIMYSGYFGIFDIPVMTVSASSSQLRRKTTSLVTMVPSDKYQAAAIIDLLRYYKWSEVSILSSNDEYGINAIVDLQTRFLADGNFEVKNILIFDTYNDTPDVGDQLDTLWNSLDRVIIYFGSSTHIRVILEQAKSVGLLEQEFAWIVADAVAANVGTLAYNGSYMSYYEGLIGIRPKISRSAMYDDFKDEYVKSVPHSDDHLTDYNLLTYDGLKFIDKALTGLTLADQDLVCDSSTGQWESGDNVLDALTSTEYDGITGPIAFTEEGEVEDVSYDIVNFVGKTFVLVGAWHLKTGLEMTSSVKFLGNKGTQPAGIANELNGMHLRLGIIPEMPFVSEPSLDCGDITDPSCYTGINVEIMHMMSEELNFTYNFIMPDDMKFGGKNTTTGEWNGLIRDLLDNKTDMIIVALSNNAVRKADIDFSFPIMDGGLGALVKSDSEGRDVFFFLRPFDSTVWVAIIVGCALVTSMTYIFSKLSPYGVNGSLLYAQNTCKCEECEGGELLNQDKYEWGVVDSRNPELLLSSNQNPDYNRIAEEAVKVGSYSEGMERLRAGGFVFIDEFPGISYETKGECDIVQIGDAFQPFELAYGLRKNSAYKNLVDSYILGIREKGGITELYAKYENQKTSKPCTAGNSLTMHFSSLSGVFWIIPMGMGAALICLLGEYVYVAIKDTRTNKMGLSVALGKRLTKHCRNSRVKRQKRVTFVENPITTDITPSPETSSSPEGQNEKDVDGNLRISIRESLSSLG